MPESITEVLKVAQNYNNARACSGRMKARWCFNQSWRFHLIQSHACLVSSRQSNSSNRNLISSHLLHERDFVSMAVHPILCHLVSPHIISCNLVSSHLVYHLYFVSNCLVQSNLISSLLSHRISSHLKTRRIWAKFIPRNVVSSHLISSLSLLYHLSCLS